MCSDSPARGPSAEADGVLWRGAGFVPRRLVLECPERQASDLILIWGPAGVLPRVETGRCRLYAGLHALLRQADAIFFSLASGSLFLPALPLLCSGAPESPRAGGLYTRLVPRFYV